MAANGRGGISFQPVQMRSESCFFPTCAFTNPNNRFGHPRRAAGAGCYKRHPAAAVEEATNAVPVATNTPAPVTPPVPSRTRDLGVLLLTNLCETTIQLGGGKSCTVTPHLIDPKRLQLTMVLESKMPDGKTRGLNIMKVVSQPDQQFEFVFGGLSLTVTPQMAGETNLPAKTP